MENFQNTNSRPRCRFDMFVRIRPDYVKGNDGKTQFTYRGDKFTSDPPQMLKSLLRLLKKRSGQFTMVIVYDNTKPKGEPGHAILHIDKGVVKINLLDEYRLMLEGMHFPELFSWQP